MLAVLKLYKLITVWIMHGTKKEEGHSLLLKMCKHERNNPVYRKQNKIGRNKAYCAEIVWTEQREAHEEHNKEKGHDFLD